MKVSGLMCLGIYEERLLKFSLSMKKVTTLSFSQHIVTYVIPHSARLSE